MSDHASLCSIDVGFDLRLHQTLARINQLPLDYEAGTGPDAERRTITAGAGVEAIGEALARAGYGVVVAQTANGREIQCTPPAWAPAGDCADHEWTGPVWAVQAKHDNYWCLGPSMLAALDRAGWRPDECRELWREDHTQSNYWAEPPSGE